MAAARRYDAGLPFVDRDPASPSPTRRAEQDRGGAEGPNQSLNHRRRPCAQNVEKFNLAPKRKGRVHNHDGKISTNVLACATCRKNRPFLLFSLVAFSSTEIVEVADSARAEIQNH